MKAQQSIARDPRPVESVGFLLIPGFALMAYACALEPLRAANQLAGKQLYRWWHTAPADSPAAASNGVAVLPDHTLDSRRNLPDLLIICAGGNPSKFNDKRTFAWLRRLASDGVIMGGVSGGPLILAKAGLLEGRRCTVHWEHVPAMHEAHPTVEVTRSLFELDGDRITCSGGVAALDMMIALIGRDHGFELAAAVSDWFLHTQVRDGTGPQRMDLRFRLSVSDPKLLSALRAMEAHLEKPLSRTQLARRAGTSIRQLERIFRRHLARSMHQHYLSLRLVRAQQLLRQTSLSILEVALATGFNSGSTFSRAFRKRFAMAPRHARQPTGAAPG
jgi:transcriptional regulator GlxA family with amidase domain